MPSTFTWLDASEHDRRRALEVIDLFNLGDTRDQLGLASIRDAWSDRLVPGTSTIQTRARYFFFVPWIYQDLERRRVSSESVEGRARKAELDLIEAIQATDPEAVPIGASVGRKLKRLPSDIYWGGLGVLRVRLFEGSRSRYHRTFGSRPAGPNPEGSVAAHWNPHLPSAPDEFPERASLDLLPEEAGFLREQILQHADGSWLAHLVGLDAFWDDVEAPWDHPEAGHTHRALRRDLEWARLFSLAMHGAALLYNLMMAQALRHEEWVDNWQAEYDGWSEQAASSAGDLVAWDRDAFWAGTLDLNRRIPPHSRMFAEGWITRLLASLPSGSVGAIAVDPAARRQVQLRESFLKRGRARLTHREHLHRWNGANGSGAAPLDYRWPITQRLVRDIQRGLGNA